LVVLIVMAAGVWSLRNGTGRKSEDLPVLGKLPDFSLIERSGRPLTRSDLAGKVWVANFIFTSCAGVCPLLSSRMATLRQSLAGIDPPVLSVSMSVDPTRDSPEVLRGYAERYKADPDDWLFVTGPPAEIRRLIGEGFLLSIAERSAEEAGDTGELITHSDRFVLVDEDSQIRGYYRGAESDELARLTEDIRRLTRRG
jgi:cytochrome oxidase Cu insertion factor (SCO1/SenC/PrrC family)